MIEQHFALRVLAGDQLKPASVQTNVGAGLGDLTQGRELAVDADAAGTYPLVVRSIANLAASSSENVTVAKYAPAVFVDSTGQIALFHANGQYVNTSNPATRDEPLTMYATGLGVTTGGAVTAGNVSPSSPLAVSAPVLVYFGLPGYSQAGVIVDWSGLAPGFIGVYQLNLQIPGTHLDGNALPVTISIGGIRSPTTGPAVPYVAVN